MESSSRGQQGRRFVVEVVVWGWNLVMRLSCLFGGLDSLWPQALESSLHFLERCPLEL
jgi:hypothetical protein